MLYIIYVILAIAGSVFAGKKELDGTNILNAVVVLRHGDRTPTAEELVVYPNRPIFNSTYYPYGYGALTNSGKRRAYQVGKYLRSHFDGWLSKVYLPEEVVIRTTAVDRTKMTALVALAALYKPENIQQWNRGMDLDLEWQPVPYTFLPYEEDDLLSLSSCAAYETLFTAAAESFTEDTASAYDETYALLTEYSGYNITDLATVFYLQGVVLGQESYGVPRPEWYTELEDKIEEIVNYYSEAIVASDSMKRLAGGVLLSEFLDASSLIIAGEAVEPTLTIYSSHDMTVIAALAVSRNFNNPHRPGFGATFSLELRQNATSGDYGVATVYAPMDGHPAEVIRIDGCGDVPLCPYDTFLELTANYTITREDWLTECAA